LKVENKKSTKNQMRRLLFFCSSLVIILTTLATLVCLVDAHHDVEAEHHGGPSSLFSNHHDHDDNNNNPIEEITSFCQITSIIRDRYRATVIFFYDSADLNSWRVRNVLIEGANLLNGFARVVAADIRNPNVTMLRAAWSVNTVPWTYGLGPKHFKPRTEDFGSSSSSLSL